jgi:hypothetical protein
LYEVPNFEDFLVVAVQPAQVLVAVPVKLV